MNRRGLIFMDSMNSIRPRWCVRNLEAALKVLVTVVTGAHQTGKTALVRSLSPARD
jgi:hypothetical protein